MLTPSNPEKVFPFLDLPMRDSKPRRKGLTVVSDCGTPIRTTADILEVAGRVIDGAKFTDHSGMIGRYSPSWVQAKLSLYHEHDIYCLVGGAVFELAYLHGCGFEYLNRVAELGFSAVEISEDLIPPLPDGVKLELVQRARELGLEVFTEFGRKFPDQPLTLEDAVESIRADLRLGVRSVVLEESEVLQVKRSSDEARILSDLVKAVGPEAVMFEARYPDTQSWLISTIGTDVNLENIELSGHQPLTVLERMRTGMHRHVGYNLVTSTLQRIQKGA